MESYKKKTAILHIHESIIILILCYLPVDSIIRCRSVCKNWATLIFSQYFQESYSRSATPPLQFLLNSTVGRATKNHKHFSFAHLYPASCNARSDCALPVLTKYVLPGFESSSHIIKICSTCNFTGFIVAYAYTGPWDKLGHPYYIFNPITSQHFVVKQNSNFWENCALLFAHRTNQLKLLRASRVLSRECKVEIQTIGTDSWRTLRTSTSLIYNRNIGFPCYLNGIYHWPCSVTFRGEILCFNADEEVLHNITTPYYIACLGILDGCLAFLRGHHGKDFEFWVMKEYGVSESWIKKFVIPNNEIIGSLAQPIRFLKHGETVVLCDEYNDYNVVCYNPSTGNCKFITYYIKTDSHFWYVPIPYVPNFTKFVSGR